MTDANITAGAMVMVAGVMKNPRGTLGCRLMTTLEVIACCNEMLIVELLCGLTTSTLLGRARRSGNELTYSRADDELALQLHTAETVTTQEPAPIQFTSNEKSAARMTNVRALADATDWSDECRVNDIAV